MLLARSGHRTLLIDADFYHPSLHEQLQFNGTTPLITSNERVLSCVKQTTHTQLFALSAFQEGLTNTQLIELLPELQPLFDIIIIDAPPLTEATTHQLATKTIQTLLVVKKRHDSLKMLKIAHTTCKGLKLHVQGLLVG